MMSLRRLDTSLGVVGLCLASLCVGGHALAQDERAPARPHVVVILADDLGTGDLGCYNPKSKIPTPHLDELRAEGMRFMDMHSPSAVCTPTRYGLLTGRYAWRTRLKQWTFNGYGTALIDPGQATLANVLKGAGYRTGGFGKWHLGLGNGETTDYATNLRPGPMEVGFDRYFGIPASLDFEPYVWIDDGDLEAPPTVDMPGSKPRRGGGEGFWRKGKAAEGFDFEVVLDRIVDGACGWLEDTSKAGDDPMFLYLPLSAPHTPWMPTAEFRGASEAGPYGDFVAQVDAGIGRVLATLERLGIADETLVIVTSDNGAHWVPGDIKQYGHRANGSWRGQKADIHEGGHRVPFLARWPGVVPAGSENGQLLGLVDVFATVVDALQLAPPEGSAPDSRSFAMLLRGEHTIVPVRDHLVHHSGAGVFALRLGEWKLVEGLGSGGFSVPRKVPESELADGDPRGQLYNLDADPGETRNLWNEEPEVVKRLQAKLKSVRAEG